MTKKLTIAFLFSMVAVMSTAFATEKTVTLTVENMSCISCPYIVKKTLTRIPGVKSAEVSYEKKTAVVTFDDAKTNVSALTEATANIGYPAKLVK